MLLVFISITDNENWRSIWTILFVFLAIPLLLLALKDTLAKITPKWLGPSQLLLHICAIFSALIGYGLGLLAVKTGHEKAHLHQILVIIFPALVYSTPLLMVFHGMPLGEIKKFYFKTQNNKCLTNESSCPLSLSAQKVLLLFVPCANR